MLLVVGDKFAQFTTNKNAITLSQLKEKFHPQESNNCGQTILVPGQGLGDSDIEVLLSIAEKSPNRHQFDFTLWYKVPKRAATNRSHKHCPENTLISEPRKLTEDLYELDLLIDENCELMRDHQTGQHLQGMVLLEAARQSFLAVTEAFFLPDNSDFFFVLNDVEARYNHFAFPFAAQISYKIVEKNTNKPTRKNFQVDMGINQMGFESASFRMTFSAIKNELMVSREASLANKTFDSYFDNLYEKMSESSTHRTTNV